MIKKENMSGFRLIAIRTGKFVTSPTSFLKHTSLNTKVDWLKILKENTVYPFNLHFDFPNNDFKIIKKTGNPINIFPVRLSNQKVLPINAQAIVGENGTGKSTLVEIIYWMNYNLGTINEHLKTEDKEIYEINKGFNAELFYQSEDKYFNLVFKEGKVQQYEINFDNNVYNEPKDPKFYPIRNFQDLRDFFYTVVINYSQHSLNALEIGDWIDPLFHKNDAYQTPIVINPQRHNGIINVNKERLLLSRRLQSNILEKFTGKVEYSLRNLANGKIAEKMEVEYNQNYFNKDKSTLKQLTFKTFNAIAKQLEKLYDLDFSNDDLKVLFSTEIRFSNGEDTFLDKEKILKRVLLTYIFCKLKKLVRLYEDYKPYRTNFPSQIPKILEKVHKSNSHLIFKLKGAILHLKYFKEIYPLENWNFFSNKLDINISEFSEIIHSKIIPKEEEFFVNTFMMAMPSFWNIEIIPTERNLISQFSSGEKQRIYSISSIVYHIINLNSVEENKKIKEYKYINLVLDEIELYYHPEWQRTFIYDLISYIEKINPLNLNNIEGLNILFVTHSPFILSDIPSESVLRLSLDKDGRTKAYITNRETFGANIHDLLANDFFLKNGFMGEFAKRKINEVIEDLQETINEKVCILPNRIEEIERIISIIGEPLLKNSLNSLYVKANPDRKDEFIQLQIDRLNSLKNE